MIYIFIDELEIKYDYSKDDNEDLIKLQENVVVARSARNRVTFVRTVTERSGASKGVNMPSFCNYHLKLCPGA